MIGTLLQDGRTVRIPDDPTNHPHKLAAATANSTISNTTIETEFTPNATLAANSLAVGQVYRITARGILSTA